MMNPYRIVEAQVTTDCFRCRTAGHMGKQCYFWAWEKQEEKKRGKGSEEAIGTVEGETYNHKGKYLKCRKNDWKGERAGRHDGAKECTVDVLCLKETK